MARVLIVEDERSIRQALRFAFEDDGYEVLQACDYLEAVDTLKNSNFDIIITDIHIKKGDCLQLMNLLEKNDREVPFIVMTAFPETEIAVEAKSILKDRYFEKPFFTPDLTNKVGEILNSRSIYSMV